MCVCVCLEVFKHVELEALFGLFCFESKCLTRDYIFIYYAVLMGEPRTWIST